MKGKPAELSQQINKMKQKDQKQKTGGEGKKPNPNLHYLQADACMFSFALVHCITW